MHGSVVLRSKIENLESSFTNHHAQVVHADLQEVLGWTTVKTRRHNAMLYQVHRCLRKEAPSYFKCKFLTDSNLNYSATRGATTFYLNRPNTNFYIPINFQVHGCINIQQPPMQEKYIGYIPSNDEQRWGFHTASGRVSS